MGQKIIVIAKDSAPVKFVVRWTNNEVKIKKKGK